MRRAKVYLKNNPKIDEVILYSECVYSTLEGAQQVAQKIADRQGCLCQIRDGGHDAYLVAEAKPKETTDAR